MTKLQKSEAPENFGLFVLTHGRPHMVTTLSTVRRRGYTGPIWLVCDDEDKRLGEYQERYPGMVLVFSKTEIAKQFDQMDNFTDRRSVVFARNACWELARQVGVRYFAQFDDDYTGFYFRDDVQLRQCQRLMREGDLDSVLATMVEYLTSASLSTVCMCQGGDLIGGPANTTIADKVTTKRKAMNTFVCDTERPFWFSGRINEDVNTYVRAGVEGRVMLTLMSVQVNQRTTQKAAGGMTELYQLAGTYVKSFYSVMAHPSGVKIHKLGLSHERIHHMVIGKLTYVKILHEKHRRPNFGSLRDEVTE
jgi:hypothetical protein